MPRHRSIRSQPAKVGQLRVIEEYNREFRRNVVYALLLGHHGRDVTPRLHDAVVRHVADGCMTISGFERDELTGHCLGQSWFVQVYVDFDEDTRLPDGRQWTASGGYGPSDKGTHQ